MNITIAEPMKVHHYRPRHDWSPLLVALEAAPVGTHLCVPISDLPPGSMKRTQGALHAFVNRRGMRIHTRVEDESLFIALLEKFTLSTAAGIKVTAGK